MRAMLIANPKATSTSRRARELLLRAFSGDLDVVLAETGHRGHATELARRAADEGFDVVVALGGDGTVNEAVNGLLAQGHSDDLPALVVLPIGSANVFARALGLPNDPLAATRNVLEALRAGRHRSVGLAVAELSDGTQRYFTFNAGVGLDAEVVREVELRRLGGAKADPSLYVRTALRHFFMGTDRKHPALTLEVPGRPAKEGLFLAFVSNAAPWTFLGPLPVNPSPKANFSRGLDVFGVQSLDTVPTMAAVLRMMLARTQPVRGREVVNVHDAPQVTLHSDRPVAFQLDGDYLGEQEGFVFRSVPKAIRIVI